MKRCILLMLMAVFAISAATAANYDRYDRVIFSATEKHETIHSDKTADAFWHKGRIMQESGFNEFAVSPVGAMGLCQFIKPTAEAFGVDPWNAESAIDGMIRYTLHIRDYYSTNDGVSATHINAFDRANSKDKEMITDAGYNWRMDRITRLCRAYGWNWDALKWRVPLETRNYAPSIQRWKEKFAAEALRHKKLKIG